MTNNLPQDQQLELQQLENEFKKTLSAFLDSESLPKEDIQKIWHKFNTADLEGKKEALFHLNKAWSEFENSVSYINRISNEASFGELQDINAKYQATVDFHADVAELMAREAKQDLDQINLQLNQLELEERSQNLQQRGYNSNKKNRVLSLDELLNQQNGPSVLPVSPSVPANQTLGQNIPSASHLDDNIQKNNYTQKIQAPPNRQIQTGNTPFKSIPNQFYPNQVRQGNFAPNPNQIPPQPQRVPFPTPNNFNQGQFPQPQRQGFVPNPNQINNPPAQWDQNGELIRPGQN